MTKLGKPQAASNLTSGHNGRFDGSRAPFGMNGLEKGSDARDVRAGHGVAGDYIKRDAPSVADGRGRGLSSGVRSQYVHTRRCYVRLQMRAETEFTFESSETNKE